MSNQNDENEDIIIDLVDSVDEYVSTDVITDVKSGIYNLFVSLVDHYTLDFGPAQGAIQACEYLERLVADVRQALENPNIK